MKTTSAKSKNVSNNAAKQQVKTANTTRRVVETRDMWEVIFNHSVSLVVAYVRGQKPADPRKGFAFGAVANEPNSRGYAKSLIWGLTTSKAHKALKGFDELGTREACEKIALAILTDCTLVKGDSKAINASLAKIETKRERVFAESVLKELSKPQTEPATTPKGGDTKVEEPKATAPKGSKAKSEKKAAPKGAKKSNTKASK